MSRKVKTISRLSERYFDSAVNDFTARDYVKVEKITYNAVATSAATVFIAHIEYIDARE